MLPAPLPGHGCSRDTAAPARHRGGIACSTASVHKETDKRHGSPCKQAGRAGPIGYMHRPAGRKPLCSHRGCPRAFPACSIAAPGAPVPQQELVSPLEAPKGHLVAAALDPSSQRAPLTAPCAQGPPEGSEQTCPGPALPGFKTHQFPLPFPPNQPAESFINLRKRKSKQKEPKAEPMRDLSNLPSLSSLGPRYYLSAIAESPPSGNAPGPSGGAGPRHSPCSSNDCVISAVSSSASLRRRRGDALPGLAVPGEQCPAPQGMDSSRQSMGFGATSSVGMWNGALPMLGGAAAGMRV